MTNQQEKNPKPPCWATRLLQKYTNPELSEEIEGDLAEAFQDNAVQKSLWQAKLMYIVQVLRFINPFSKEHPRDHYPKARMADLLMSYLKLSSRYLFKHKGFTLMNLLGLAVGLTACLVIFFYVEFELHYDTFHQNADRIFRISTQLNSGESVDHIAPTANGIAMTLKERYPEVEEAARFIPTMAIIKNTAGELFSENYFFKADPEVFKIFTYPMLAGNSEEALKMPHSVVLTEAMAAKYFANINLQQVLGQTMIVNNQSYQVTGVLKNLPENSDLLFDALLSWQFNAKDTEQWMDFGSYTYLLLHDQESVKTLAQKLSAFDKEFDDRIVKEWGISYLTVHHYLHPLTSLHYNNTLMGDTEHKGNRAYIYIFSCIAVFILIIACINYVNFSVAQASGRTVEAGVRKTAGARQKQLWLQFMSESFLVTLFALLIAVGLVWLVGKHFTHLIGESVTPTALLQPAHLGLLAVILLLVTLLSGSYPAFILAAVNPVKALKGSNLLASHKGRLRKVLLLVQFTLALVMVISTLVVRSQIQYMSHKNLGYNQQVLSLTIPDDSVAIQKLPVLKNKILQKAGVSGVSMSSRPDVLSMISTFSVENGGETHEISAFGINADEDYLKVMDIPLVDGTDFNPALQGGQVLVNEAFVKKVGWKQPIGQEIHFSETASSRVVGVVHDFHYTSLHKKIEPFLIFYSTEHPVNVLINVQPDQVEEIHAFWQSVLPDFPFEYEFLDQAFDQKYKAELSMMTLFNYFSGLSIFIACMGLLGLVSFTVRLKTKEIGIRKVLGADKKSIIYLVSREFIMLLLLATVFSLPLSYYAMNFWLQNFAYRTGISVGIMLMSVVAMGLLVMLTLSYHALRAAYANPVHSLRNE